MTTIDATSQSCICPILVPYTGTKDQPDTVSFFIKNDQNQVSFAHESIHAKRNYYPWNFHDAIDRISEAVNKIFLCMIGKEDDLWNATQNLTRGVVALIPFIGSATLYLYDKIKTNFYINPKIKNSLASQCGSIIGIASDGKVIKTFSLGEFSKAFDLSRNPLDLLHYVWLNALKIALDQSPNTTQEKLVSVVARNISTYIIKNKFLYQSKN